MSFQFSGKKLIFFLIIILLLFIGGVFLLWWLGKDVVPEQGEIISKRWSLKGETYEITTNDLGQKFVEYKEEGLKIKVPEAWIVKKYYEEVDILDPGVEFNEYGGISGDSIRKGACGMAVEISKSEKVDSEIPTDVEDLRNLIEIVQKNPEEMKEKEGYDIIEIDRKLALRWIIRKDEGEIISITVEVPIDNTIYTFDSGVIFSENCVDKFNKILETVLINK